jgi:hypothetical protein
MKWRSRVLGGVAGWEILIWLVVAAFAIAMLATFAYSAAAN